MRRGDIPQLGTMLCLNFTGFLRFCVDSITLDYGGLKMFRREISQIITILGVVALMSVLFSGCATTVSNLDRAWIVPQGQGNLLWVSSVPQDAQVYIAEADTQFSVSSSDYSFSPQSFHYKGNTPISIELAPGAYHVLIKYKVRVSSPKSPPKFRWMHQGQIAFLYFRPCVAMEQKIGLRIYSPASSGELNGLSCPLAMFSGKVKE
jgi:hypothetical protein